VRGIVLQMVGLFPRSFSMTSSDSCDGLQAWRMWYVDADNCCNRIAHPMTSMVFQSFGVPTQAIGSMLTTIQNMKFFLCTGTGYGDSVDYPGGAADDSEDPVNTQGRFFKGMV
jgi:hypothetical protein